MLMMMRTRNDDDDDDDDVCFVLLHISLHMDTNPDSEPACFCAYSLMIHTDQILFVVRLIHLRIEPTIFPSYSRKACIT